MKLTVDWSKLKAFADSKKLHIQYVELDDSYMIIAFDGPFSLDSLIAKSNPRNQAQIEFEDNYKNAGNRKLSDPLKPVYSFKDLVNGTSRKMNVRGTLAAPIDFSFTPGEQEVWEIEKLLFGLDDVGLTDMGLLGGLTAPTNGILITIRMSGVVHTVGTIKDNADVAMMFPGMTAGQSGVLDSSDGIFGSLTFKDPMILSAASGDYIKISIRDDLTGINILRSMVVARKVL